MTGYLPFTSEEANGAKINSLQYLRFGGEADLED